MTAICARCSRPFAVALPRAPVAAYCTLACAERAAGRVYFVAGVPAAEPAGRAG